MRRFALLTCSVLAAAAIAATAGVVTAAVADPGSAVIVVVVVVLGALVIGLLEWTHRRAGVRPAVHGADLSVSAESAHGRDRDTVRALDELRAARARHGIPTAGTAHGPVNHALRSV